MATNPLLTQAVHRYERHRALAALAAAMMTLIIPLLAFAVGRRAELAGPLGVLMFGLIALFLFRGQGWSMAVPAGLKAGLIPLMVALATQHLHACTEHGCTSVCVPACSVGGAVAGVVMVWLIRKSRWPTVTLVGSAALAVAVGSMGCSCVGYSGVVAMVAGMAITTTGSWVVLRRSMEGGAE